MNEYYPKTMSLEEKLDFLINIPNEIKTRAYYLERIYGTIYILKLKDGTYDLYYPNYETGKLEKDV